MRSLLESTARWQETLNHSSSLLDLRRAVKDNGEASPCISGCRSICWKMFLLGQETDAGIWKHSLLESRSTYSSLREHFLKYVNHPEYLTAASSDPLADDPDSPWNTVRRDEVLRAEILQDVQRLPEVPFYHEPHVQTLILDVLFIYCKLNPDVGGYRQGMHELLAPIVYVVNQDAINPVDAASDSTADLAMVEMLDASFIEHDAFALFSRLMDHAKGFYEVSEVAPTPKDSLSISTPDQTSTPGQLSQTSSIVEKSQHIHEVCLHQVDPELSEHLKNIEVLPQIFLIRWIRLLFSREFPFDQVLILWDTLFALDPTLRLIDLICTAMLIRIRWDLLEADYSVALQLLLKYPPPQPPYGPHTFVGDALYLRDHLDANGGSTLTAKYTGKPPTSGEDSSRSTTPRTWNSSLRRKAAGTRSPLSPARFIQQQGGVEAIFQGAAKGVIERGERLGINQAVRDAMVEIRRNVSEARSNIKANKDIYSDPRSNTAMRGLAAMEKRNKQLALMLDETVDNLKTLAKSPIDDKEKHREELEVSVAKLQFVRVYLEDSTMALPEEQTPPLHAQTAEHEITASSTTPLTDAVAALDLDRTKVAESPSAPSPAQDAASPSNSPQANPATTDADPLGSGIVAPMQSLQRPHAPIPTRSTLAQSSFSWMLEPDESASSSQQQMSAAAAASARSPANPHRKRPSANANRERTAFLFGEVPLDEEDEEEGEAARGRRPMPTAPLPGNMFGMEPLGKSKS